LAIRRVSSRDASASRDTGSSLDLIRRLDPHRHSDAFENRWHALFAGKNFNGRVLLTRFHSEPSVVLRAKSQLCHSIAFWSRSARILHVRTIRAFAFTPKEYEMEISRLLSRPAISDDALDVLTQDHAAITELFSRYRSTVDQMERKTLVSRILRLLTVHMRIEEDLFYPALAKALASRAAIDDSYVAHAAIRKSMASLDGAAGVQASSFDAKVGGFAHLVEQHIAVHEGRIFDQARSSGLDLVAIGRQLDAYRTALQYRYDLDRDGAELKAYLATPTLFGAARPVGSSKPVRFRSALASKRHGKTERRSMRRSALKSTRRARRTHPGALTAGPFKGESI
jgi:Hemerythrin HHE cation binding domain